MSHRFKVFKSNKLLGVFNLLVIWVSSWCRLFPQQLFNLILLGKATIGYIVPEYFKWPGYLSPSMGLKFADVPNGLAAIGKVPGNGWAQIVAFAGYYELSVYQYKGVPGEYGWKAISSQDPEVRKRKLNAELANGRLASRKLNASNVP